MSLLSRRSKSVSNVIETPTFDRKDVKNSIEDRYKACSSDNLYTGKQSEVNTSLNIHKSQNFFTKFVATREKRNKKNGDFIANDEFLTKCYKRSPIPRINLHYSNNSQFTNCDYNEKRFSLDKKKISESNIKIVNSSKKLLESSAILSVEKVDNWIATKRETSNAVNEKKVNRRKSIKVILNTLIGMKKHTEKEKLRNFRSCDELEGGEKISSMNIPIIPRARSSQTFTLETNKDQINVESLDRNATIRPFYGGRRNHTIPQKFLESCHLKTFKEDSGYGSGFFSVDESDDNLVKPSAVREIARRLSYHPSQPSKEILNTRKREKCSYRRKSFTNNISDIESYKSLDLANSNVYSSPVTRKLKDEYVSVLANNKRLSAKYENTHIACYRSQYNRP